MGQGEGSATLQLCRLREIRPLVIGTTMATRRRSNKKSEITRQAYYIGLATGEFSALSYVDVTEKIGSRMPFNQPHSALGLSLSRRIGLFSLLSINNRSRPKWREQTLQMPKGPLARLERKAPGNIADLGAGGVRMNIRLTFDVEQPNAAGESDLSAMFESEGPTTFNTRTDSHDFELEISRDEGVGTVGGRDAEAEFELPKAAVKASLYFNGLNGTYPCGVGFIGHVGEPGKMCSAARAAGVILRYMLYLPEFRSLSGMTALELPAGPVGSEVQVRPQLSNLMSDILFTVVDSTDKNASVLEEVKVQAEISLSEVNHLSDRYALLCKVSPHGSGGSYYNELSDRLAEKIASTVETRLDKRGGEGTAGNIARDIWLGDIGETDRARVEKVLGSIGTVLSLPKGQMKVASKARS